MATEQTIVELASQPNINATTLFTSVDTSDTTMDPTGTNLKVSQSVMSAFIRDASPSTYDCIVDAVGNLPNRYINVKAAADAGMQSMKVIANISDNEQITLTSNIYVYLKAGVTWTNSLDSLFNKNSSAYLITIEGADRFTSIINYTPSTTGARWAIGGIGSRFVIFKNVKFSNLSAVANTSICESDALITESSTIIAGNADNAGANYTSINCYATETTVGSSGAGSTNAFVATIGTFDNINLSNADGVIGKFAVIDASARVSNLTVGGESDTTIIVNGYVTGINNLSTNINITVDASNANLIGFEANNLKLSSGQSKILLMGGTLTGAYTPNDATTIRSGNDNVIGNDYPATFLALQGGVDRASAVPLTTSGTVVQIGTITIPANSNAMVSFTAAITDSAVTPATLTSLSFWIDTVSAGGALVPCDTGIVVLRDLNSFATNADIGTSFAGKIYNTTGSPLTLYLNGTATGTLFSTTTKMYGYIQGVSI